MPETLHEDVAAASNSPVNRAKLGEPDDVWDEEGLQLRYEILGGDWRAVERMPRDTRPWSRQVIGLAIAGERRKIEAAHLIDLQQLPPHPANKAAMPNGFALSFAPRQFHSDNTLRHLAGMHSALTPENTLATVNGHRLNGNNGASHLELSAAPDALPKPRGNYLQRIASLFF